MSILWREDIIAEVSRREKEAGIIPDPDIDIYMKVLSKSQYESFMS